MNSVVPFPRSATTRRSSWSQQELAEFYRVEAALGRAGLSVTSEHGVTDEGEPWFVFCKPNGDAIIHFARIDGDYLIASEVLEKPVYGPDFRALVDHVARLHPALLPVPEAGKGTKIMVHPAALLAALVTAAALALSSEDAHAGELDGGAAPLLPPAMPHTTDVPHARQSFSEVGGQGGDLHRDADRKQREIVVLSAMMFAAEAAAADQFDLHSSPDFLQSGSLNAVTHHAVQDEFSLGSGVADGSGAAGAPSSQPTAQTARGSNGTFSNTTGPAAGRTDSPATARPDARSDHAGPQASDSGHLSAVAPDGDAVPRPTDASTARTGEQISPASARSDATVGSAAVASSSQGGVVSTSVTDSSIQTRSADHEQSEPKAGANSTGVGNSNGRLVLDTTSSDLANSSNGKGHAAADPKATADTAQVGSGNGNSHGKGHAAADPQAASAAVDTAQADNGNGKGHAAADPQATAAPADTAQGGNGNGNSHGKSNATADPQAGADTVQAGKGDGHAVADPQALAADTAQTGNSNGKGHAVADPRATAPASDATQAGNDHGNANGHATTDPRTTAAIADTAQAGNGSGHATSDPQSASAAADTAQASNGHGHGNGHAAHGASDTQAAATSSDPGIASGDANGSPSQPAEGSAASDETSSQHVQGLQPAQATNDAPRDPSGPHADPALHTHGHEGRAAVTDEAAHASPSGPTPQPKPSGTDHSPTDPPVAASSSDGVADHSSSASTQDPAHHDSSLTPSDSTAAAAEGSKGHSRPTTVPLVHEASQADPSAQTNGIMSNAGGHATAVTKSGRPDTSASPTATVDANGNLVFHGNGAHGSSQPPSPHAAADQGDHPTLDVVGVPDHLHVQHDMFHHS